ncbi:VOC family protein [Mumia sp. zg.B53]|uniref:VOC family protein n=1 Tax=unclassified Mumia TaxID=2621872 RepID=UPI001C6F01E1|nr:MULTISPECIES: VOC family protein [unclassified Mumia]MBW9210242.1 VOC family protein [Mumia sp. zg.B21]MBW9214852.1 VOC family protein [Mumia sp. zg.B53]MDD9348115.1 VOC family protein [Mumia sp.]
MPVHEHLIPLSVDYVEIAVTDLPAASAFYREAFGWEIVPYGDEYAGFRTPAEPEGHEAGGLRLADEVVRGSTLVQLYADDLEACAEAVTAAGGRVVQGPYGFPGGRRFHFLDPSGNELGAWSQA